MAQIVNLISYEEFRKLDPHTRLILSLKFGDATFLEFIRQQKVYATNQIAELDPMNLKDPNEFMQLARDLRLIWRFWTDFEDFVKDCARMTGAQLDETTEV